MTAEEWLASNSFECTLLSGRFTSDQCRANRERALTLQFPGQLTPCIKCGGEQDMVKVKDQKVKRPYNRKVKPAEVEAKPTPVIDGKPQEFVDHSAPVTQEDLECAADRFHDELVDHLIESGSITEYPLPDVRSLLHFIQPSQDAPTPPQPPGFFVDFTGHEQLLAEVQALSDDLNSDMIALLSAVLDGELYRRKEAMQTATPGGSQG